MVMLPTPPFPGPNLFPLNRQRKNKRKRDFMRMELICYHSYNSQDTNYHSKRGGQDETINLPI
jgi:hypothetical protein